MITCQNCRRNFEFSQVRFGILSQDGNFEGVCPYCGFDTRPIPGPSTAKHSDDSVLSFVETMEMAGDNFCQRCVNLLWERNWRAQCNGAMQ